MSYDSGSIVGGAPDTADPGAGIASDQTSVVAAGSDAAAAAGADAGHEVGGTPDGGASSETAPGLKPHTEVASLLEAAGTPEVKADGKVEVAETAPVVVETVEPFKYEAFALPEGFDPAAEQMQKFSELAGRHRIPQEEAQALVDMHTSTLRAYAEELAAKQHETFAETRRGWQTEIKSDPVMGGAGFQTTGAAVARMRDLFVSKADRPAFDEMCRVTGVGDHPAFWRMLHNAARHFDEPTPPAPGVGPLPNGQGRGRPKSLGAVLYDRTAGR